MGKGKNKIPPPGKDPYTKFMKKAKWMQALRQSMFDLSGKGLHKEGAIIVANCFLKNQQVEKLILTHNHLGDAGVTEFAQMLKVNTTIRSIHLGVNEITDVGGVMLASALLVNRTLTEVFIPGNSFGDDTAVAFAFALKSNRELKRLDLSWNAIGHRGATALANAFKKNHDFIFDLGQNRIGDEGCKALAEAQKEFGQKQLHGVVNYWQNDVGKVGGVAISELCLMNDRLQVLNLSWNSVGSAVGEIAKQMQVNVGCGAWVKQTDEELQKQAKALVDDGFKKSEDFKYIRGQETVVIPTQIWIQDPLKPTCTVTDLNLSQNLIGDDACEQLGILIGMDAPLKTLNLSWNVIGAEGSNKLCEGLKKGTTLQSLNLAHNKITDAAAPALLQVITTNTSLGSLWLQRNEMKEEGKNMISNGIPKGSKMRVNYGALDDMMPLIGVYGAPLAGSPISLSEDQPLSRKFSSVSAMSSATDNSGRRSSRANRRKSASRGSVGSLSTTQTSNQG